MGAGCALISACLFPSVGELTGGTDAAIESAADTSVEASSDGGFDGGTCGDGSSLFCDKLCKTPTTFCEDFDHDQVFGAWQTTPTSQGGNVVYDPSVSASPPRSAKCTTPGSSINEQVYAGLQRDFAGAARVVLDFDVRIEQPTSSAETGLFQFTLYPTPPYDYATAAVDILQTFSVKQTTHLLDGGYMGNDTTFTDAAVPFGAWHHVQLDMDFAGKTAKLAIDGQPVSTTALNNGFMPGSKATLTIGQYYAYGPTPPLTIHIDDVVVDSTP